MPTAETRRIRLGALDDEDDEDHDRNLRQDRCRRRQHPSCNDDVDF
jgi:hypothetical protein